MLSKFGDLVEAVLRDTTLERLRISSLGVEFLSDRVIEYFSNPRINAYAHLSIQSGSSDILRAMNRHYDGEQVRDVLQKLRNIERTDGTRVNIWADLIVGFPGETDRDFADTLEIVEKYAITQLHAFPFSPHIDHYSVPAGSYKDQVPNHIAQSRLKALQKMGDTVYRNYAWAHIDTELAVLIEKTSPTWWYSGWSQNYLACDESNFIPHEWQKIARGLVVRGIYRGSKPTNE